MQGSHIFVPPLPPPTSDPLLKTTQASAWALGRGPGPKAELRSYLLWPRPLRWSGRCRPSDLKVPSGRVPGSRWKAIWRGDGIDARRAPRPRDLHDVGVRTSAGEPRMRTGEGLTGRRCPSPSPVFWVPFCSGTPVVHRGSSEIPPLSAHVIPATP